MSSERGTESIYVFEIDDTYHFSHYFARTDIFTDLAEYYRESDYRFEIPADDYPEVEALLERNHYDPIVVDDISQFSVVKETYTDHADILQDSVLTWSRDGYNFFVMESPQAVEEAVQHGATRITDTDLVLGI
jgi:hypothetical protein